MCCAHAMWISRRAPCRCARIRSPPNQMRPWAPTVSRPPAALLSLRPTTQAHTKQSSVWYEPVLLGANSAAQLVGGSPSAPKDASGSEVNGSVRTCTELAVRSTWRVHSTRGRANLRLGESYMSTTGAAGAHLLHGLEDPSHPPGLVVELPVILRGRFIPASAVSFTRPASARLA